MLVELGEQGFTHWELPIRGDGVHLGHVDPGILVSDPQYRKEVLGACRFEGAPKLLSAGFEIDRRSPLHRELEQFRACADVIAELGGRFMTAFAFDDGSVPRDERVQALREVADEMGLELLIETHRRTATQDPAQALQLATAGQALTLDHSHYVSQGLHPTTFAALRSHARLVQLRGCLQDAVEAESASEEQHRSARAWWQWLQEGIGADVPVVIEYIDRSRDWRPSIAVWKELIDADDAVFG